MPGIVKVKVLEGRNLPVMDRSADTTDAYVELKLGNVTYKTDVCRKTLNPHWNSEWYRFEMDDAELQDEPLQVRLMDHDTYSANDMIGKVYFNLNPLLLNTSLEARCNMLKSSHSSSPGSGCISGWFPVYDTIHGLRGEINLIIKLELFSDFNKFRQSSCGVHIFSCCSVPYGYYTENIFGFVEELVVEDDPEYQWIEKIRTPRASNEARQTMFYKMSGEVQRKIGLKVIELGGNAVIGYRQYFDLEGETGGVVVRGIGTAVKLNKCKQMENNTIRNSFYELKFKIPDLTVTPAFANMRSISQSDNCSIISATDSLHSENFATDLDVEDRWSLCSFASRTSCNSRYTSIETLLDQENRKPVVKSGSKLLSVARYFTSSKMRRKFSKKKKQKSLIALRKFSVIEEYKQKSNANLGSTLDEMFIEGTSTVEELHESSYLERTPAIDVRLTCHAYKENDHFSEAEFLDEPFVHSTMVTNFDGGIVSAKNHVEADTEERYEQTENKDEVCIRNIPDEEIIIEIERCMVSEKEESHIVQEMSSEREQEYVQKMSPIRETISPESPPSQQERYSVEATTVRRESDAIRSSPEMSSVDKYPDKSSSAYSLYDRLSRCLTPPLSEMTLYHMNPPSRNVSALQGFVTENELKNIRTLDLDKSFLNKLRREHVIDYYPISDSPEIKKLARMSAEHDLTRSKSTGNINEKYRSTRVLSNEKECEFGVKTENFKEHVQKVNDSVMVAEPVEEDIKPTYKAVVERKCSQTFSRNFSINRNTPETNFLNSAKELSNDSNCSLFSNKTNCDVQVTTSDCNISPEALTTSCLLMHANNPDRNISECEKEPSEPSVSVKKDSVASIEAIVKEKPPLLDVNAQETKPSECAKETVSSQNIENTSDSDQTSSIQGRNIIHKENIELMEYPFLTLSIYPEDFIVHLGGTVTARSVKLLGRISNIEEPETRDAWWTELRIEIKSHMRALACNVVLNYVENTSICDEVCVLSASGTAALVKVYDGSGSSVNADGDFSKSSKNAERENENKDKTGKSSSDTTNCSLYHIPYRKSSLPLPVKINTCSSCKKGFVADVLFITIEPFEKMPAIGQGAFIHAFVYRLKRDCKSELNAREISDGLPFLEYELNRQLMNKLRIKGMNALFGLNVQVSIGEKMISAYATGTAVLLSVLPTPPDLALISIGRPIPQHSASKQKLTDARKLLEETIRKNKIYYQLNELDILHKSSTPPASVENTPPQQEHNLDIEYFAGSKQTCVIEVDDEDDLEIVTQLIDPNPPQGFMVSATEKMTYGVSSYYPKKNIQLFTQVYRYRIPSNTPPSSFNKLFYRIVQGLYMKIHNRIPCSLNKVSFKMDIPEPDELQIRIVGMAVALKESEKSLESVSTSCSSVSELSDDLVLHLNIDKDIEQGDTLSTFTPKKQITAKKKKKLTDVELHISSLSFIPGANISVYLGNLNFVFIRESTMVKEQSGGVNNFVNNFLSDVTSIVKSHAAGIGGNAVVNFFINECLLTTHSHKNQGQCLINVGGDVVRYVPKNYKTEP